MFPSSASAYTALQDYNKSRKTSQQIMDEGSAKYDVSGIGQRVSKLRSMVGNLENSVDAVDPSVTGRTSGSLVTEAQRSALVNRERQPILKDLGKQQGALGNASGDFSMANQLAGDYARNLIGEDTTKYNRLNDSYSQAVDAEKQAEAKRQWDAQMAAEAAKFAEQQRQFNAQMAATKAAGAGSYDIKDAQGQTGDHAGAGYTPSSPSKNGGASGGGGGFNWRRLAGFAGGANLGSLIPGAGLIGGVIGASNLGRPIQNAGAMGGNFAKKAAGSIARWFR